jgi:glucose/arabinose dehydrogenase
MLLARIVLFVLALLMGLLPGAGPSAAQPTIALQPVATGLSSPVSIAHAGDGSGRLFIVQQGGRILIHDGTQILATPFLDISSRITAFGGSGESGLLGLAFHPSYASNGYFYVHYTDTIGNVVIARYGVSGNPNVANFDPELILKTITHDQGDNHNGGQLQFGPDGYLYAAVGDGGSQGDPENDAQLLDNLLGKLLRLDVDAPLANYIPGTNPFVGTPGALGEIWARGLRNPWRFGFDRQTGDLFIGDVGQSTREEIDFQLASSTGGENYGWHRMEGTLCYEPPEGDPGCDHNPPGMTLPILELAASDGNCSIIGGYRYRGVQFPALQGWYLYGDYCAGQIYGATPNPAWTAVPLLSTGFSITTFGEDQAGELYVADYGAGAIHRIVVPGQTSATLTVNKTGSGTGTVSSGSGEINCGATCSAPFPTGTPVTLTAAADAGSVFAGWSGGGCGATSPCVVTLTADTVVTATFLPVGSRILSVIVRGTDNGIYHSRNTGTAWTGWTALPGATADIPALAASGGGVLDLVVRGIDDGVYHNHFNGTAWSGWIGLPGATASIPALAASGGGVLDLVVRGIDDGVYHNHYDGTAWTGWIALPGATADIPALAASGGGVLDLVVRGSDNGVYHNQNVGAGWVGWTLIPGAATASRPALVAE